MSFYLPAAATDSHFPATRHSRLLAIRRAAYSFHLGTRLRSGSYINLLARRKALEQSILEIQASLLDLLHTEVPREKVLARRRLLLNTKRDVFNRRPVVKPLPHFHLHGHIERYREILQEREDLLEQTRPEIVRELRSSLEAFLQETAFRLAVRYSSPGLTESLDQAGAGSEGDLSPRDRGLYDYAVKIFTKANPLHLFAELIFPPSSGLAASSGHELVLNTSLLFSLESALLTLSPDRDRVWLVPRILHRTGEALEVWLTARDATRILSVKDTPALSAIVEIFASRERETGLPAMTRGDLERSLAAAFPASDSRQIQDLVETLLRRELLAAYLITDFARFAPALSGISPQYDSDIETLQRHHLAILPTGELQQVDREIREAVRSLTFSNEEPLYYVNSYGQEDLRPHEEAVREISADLAGLKRFFLPEHNFSTNDYVIRSFYRDFLKERKDTSASYLNALRLFLRQEEAIRRKYQPGVHLPDEVRTAVREWFATMAAQTGRLDRSCLYALPDHPRGVALERSLCFNGPFDYADRLFFITNVFAGEGRFVGRFLPGREAPWRGHGANQETGADILDVELAVPPWPNLNYVVPRLPVGCGFDGRLCHRYRKWIWPSDVLVERVERQGEDIIYRHSPSGRQLLFHYPGLLLAQYLPAYAQLLLLGHADSYLIPFLRPAHLPEGEDREYDPGLIYGKICLRRPAWSFRRSILPEHGRGSAPLLFAMKLREWLHGETGSVGEHWFYQLSGGTRKASRPRYLDLLNPLGAYGLRRVLLAQADNAVISFSPMHPTPEGLNHSAGSPFMTELMVEV